MYALFAALLSFAPFVHADNFEARIIVASTHKHQALVSLANKETMLIAQCELPTTYEPTRDKMPLEAFMKCTPVGESLPNKNKIRLQLENTFKERLGTSFDDATGASARTIIRHSSIMGTAAGVFATGIAFFTVPRLGAKNLGLVFSGVFAAVAGATAYGRARSAYAVNGSAQVLDRIQRSEVMSTKAQPMVIEDFSEIGLLNRQGFALARAAMTDAVDFVANELRSIVPGGGSTGGAGASASWN